MKKTKYMIREGVKFVSPAYEFDFEHDNEDDIIKLSGSLKSSEVFNNLYFFQYEFPKDVSSSVRSQFIHALKFDQDKIGKDNVDKFISNALVNLNKAVNLSTVDVVIYPQSSSTLTKDIVDNIDHFTDADRYFKYDDEKTIEFFSSMKNKKILVIDDVFTSGTTIEHILKAYQMLDPDDSNVIVIFTLIGKQFIR